MSGTLRKKPVYQGKEYSWHELAMKVGITPGALFYRVHDKHMTVEEAVAAGNSIRPVGNLYSYYGELLPLKEIARRTGRCYDVLRRKIKQGLSVEEAVEDNASSNAESHARKKLAQSDAYHERTKGMSRYEKAAFDAAVKICMQIASSSPFDFGFRASIPCCEYMFESDLLRYKISISGNIGTLAAEYKEHDLPSDLHRRYLITKYGIKEI